MAEWTGAKGSRPRIAVTGSDRGGFLPWIMTALALRAAGARPLRCTPQRAPAAAPDGVVLGGGADIDPRRYGEERAAAPSVRVEQRRSHFTWLRRLLTAPAYLARRAFKAAFNVGALEMDPPREQLELALLRTAAEHGLPVLGICRGAQLINVFFGGSLHQDLRGYDLNPGRRQSILPRNPIHVAAGSRLAALFETEKCVVNCLHNQAVNRLGEGLEVVARDRAGVVQAIEHSNHPWLVGVQWHPEYMPQKVRQRRLFADLVAAAGALRRGEDVPVPV